MHSDFMYVFKKFSQLEILMKNTSHLLSWEFHIGKISNEKVLFAVIKRNVINGRLLLFPGSKTQNHLSGLELEEFHLDI